MRPAGLWLDHTILRCFWFETEKTSSQACAQGTFWNTTYTLSTN